MNPGTTITAPSASFDELRCDVVIAGEAMTRRGTVLGARWVDAIATPNASCADSRTFLQCPKRGIVASPIPNHRGPNVWLSQPLQINLPPAHKGSCPCIGE